MVLYSVHCTVYSTLVYELLHLPTARTMHAVVSAALRAVAGGVRRAQLVGNDVVERRADELELRIEDVALRIFEHCARSGLTFTVRISLKSKPLSVCPTPHI